jgi:hypothetical protein
MISLLYTYIYLYIYEAILTYSYSTSFSCEYKQSTPKKKTHKKEVP